MKNDALLLFPPQWSPFQPALALPSLAAWLRRAGHSVECADLNIDFYDWILSNECAGFMGDLVTSTDLDEQERLGYEAIFASAPAYRDFVRSRLTPKNGESGEGGEPEDLVASQYMAVRGFQNYLSAISRVCGDLKISPYEFRLERNNLDSAELDAVLRDPPALLARYLQRVGPLIAAEKAPTIGLSCIGQEQLVWTLFLGKWIKANLGAAVVVGGTIFSRIYERGVLPARWFGDYFDIIVRNEGERPLERIISNQVTGRPLVDGVPGIVHLAGGEITASAPCAPLKTAEIPTPDFTDLPLERYFSPEITLPLLSSRGCYWGKCEFCHHGMVYGERFQAYSTDRVLEVVRELAERYGVRHFAFNDEAIPPRVLREIGNRFPAASESSWRFTGLIKFERSYTREDFENLRAAGFRSLYVGLESASERVLALMKKNNTKETMLNNLRYCKDADIWLHCFLFFGFPGETESDAKETFDFVIENADVISSFGSATFVLEHNAPIYHHVEDFGIRIRGQTARDIDVYYEFDADHEVHGAAAERWRLRLNEAALDVPKYTAVGWVPRELHLCLLSEMTIDELLTTGQAVRDSAGGVPADTPLSGMFSLVRPHPDSPACLVNLLTGQVIQLGAEATAVTEFCLQHNLTSMEIAGISQLLWDRLYGEDEAHQDVEAASHPLPAPL
ncbi:B12-binding domain-containing radical SAM protein [Paractinoplanes lichenicola]|uniref:Radical SAM protein n=1 Tax=Paractinoplanes lichenicola TaxID=2802976 RepID=A0ABS1VZ70_9ACTN|nr:radical SAM protein [Actinoplanes lichenicola]MBL7259750.1 radical SAM protein [Actinoplanes lichenicola]